MAQCSWIQTAYFEKGLISLVIVSETLYERVFDVTSIPSVLNRIEEELLALGYDRQQVIRGAMGAVVLRLEDGEVHYVPSGRGVEEVVFKIEVKHDGK